MAVRALGAALLLLLGLVATARAQSPLVCGQPRVGFLATPGAADHYTIATTPGARILLQGSSTAIGTLRLRVERPNEPPIETCSGIIEFTGTGQPATVEVRACFGSATGEYTLELNVVSESAANCGRPLRCGATGECRPLEAVGQVDAYQMELQAGQPAKLELNYLRVGRNQTQAPLLRIFDPSGNEIVSGVCMKSVSFTPAVSGVHTALVSACGMDDGRPYRIEFYTAGCPEGPTITHFGIANAATIPIDPIGCDANDRPIYHSTFGHSLSLVIEARAGENRLRAGENTAVIDGNPPDLQVINSRPLGDGNPAVCDVNPPLLGGVPASEAFDESDAVRAHVEDMGCRFDNGLGQPRGRTSSSEACTRTPEGDFAFVDSGSAIQYCAQIATAWAFPEGDTVVAARIKDRNGDFGAVREIVVRVGDPMAGSPTATRTTRPTPTTTPSRAPTATSTLAPTRTRTPSRTPTGPTPTATSTVPPGSTATATPTGDGACPGDCNGDGVVTINELVRMIGIAVGGLSVEECRAGDVNRDGEIRITELQQAVRRALDGCS